ncbi:MAG TPA: hypothetical protein VFX21_04995 [Acidimicrobiia bacterium]|nr:hypothetical protein [Acidimicrobiia bacterium]
MLSRIRFELGRGRALANARHELDRVEQSLAAIDALGARLAARGAAVQRAA